MITIGNRLDRHDVQGLHVQGCESYAYAYGDCTTKTAHGAVAGMREFVASKDYARKLNGASEVFVFCGGAGSGKLDAHVNYVRVFRVTLDKDGATYDRQVGKVTLRGSLALLRKVCAAQKTTVHVCKSRKEALAITGALLADKGLARVGVSVGVNRNGKARALALDDFWTAGLCTEGKAEVAT